MMLVGVVDVKHVPHLVATFLCETVVLDVANLALAIVTSDGAGINDSG